MIGRYILAGLFGVLGLLELLLRSVLILATICTILGMIILITYLEDSSESLSSLLQPAMWTQIPRLVERPKAELTSRQQRQLVFLQRKNDIDMAFLDRKRDTLRQIRELENYIGTVDVRDD